MEIKKQGKGKYRCSELVPGTVFVTECGSYFMRTSLGYVDLEDGEASTRLTFEYGRPVQGYFQETE